MRVVLAFVTALLFAVLSTAPASAAIDKGKRVALVIGNSAYRYAVTLPNPTNDAKLMAETLRDAGFTVIDGVDLDKAGMASIIDRFTEEAYDAEIALVFYAGHGLQVEGRNYLIPVDAQLEKAAQLQTRTIPVDTLLAALPPDPAVSVIFLDACRDNPLARTLAAALPKSRSSSMGAGLAEVQANGQDHSSGGLLIAYATDPGAVAFDGKDVHSPYTAALARHLTTPGLEIQSALTRVRAEVSEATGGAQRPGHNASLAREVFIGGDAPAAKPVLTLGADAAPSAASASGSDADWTVEQAMWEEASKRNTTAHYELYLQQYPNGRFARVARLNLDQLKEAGETQVAALPATPTLSASASQVRTAVSVPEDVRVTPGTPTTEASLNLSREDRIDLQLRLSALGHDTGGSDGSLGPKSRMAIAAWQRQSGIVETTYLTPQQRMFLVVQTDPMMPQIRAQAQARKAATPPRRQTQKVVTRRDNRAPVREGRVRRENSGGLLDSPGGAAFVGGLMGGAIGGLIGK